MENTKFSRIFLLLLVFLSFYSKDAISATTPVNYSIQNSLIGATEEVKASANYGAGVTFAVIDTGIAAPWTGFQTRIDTTKSTCIIANCSKTLAITDDNGHGTFVASEIIGNVPSIGLTGVATSAKAFAVKVLNAQGSGYGSDLANGIIYAANNGAQIINLSVGPGGSASQQAAFYQSLASAINYAASKNVVLVFAGGNSTQKLAGGLNVTGFTDAALARMMFVGSTNASKAISSFSNTPGTAGFTSSTGKFYSYSSMWLVTDGENIWGASNYKDSKNGYNYMTQMSGTSMAAPQVAGAAGLLAARWPFLLTQGTIAAILERTAQDLGTKGVDTTFGSGFVRVDIAMLPIGTLTTPVNGKNVPVTNYQIITGSALGNMNNVSSTLQKLVAYDDYKRDYKVYTSSVTAKSSSTPSASSVVTGITSSNTRKFTNFTDGTQFSYSGNPNSYENTDLNSYFAQGIDPIRQQSRNWSFSFAHKNIYMGMGEGADSSMLFNDARWGKDSVFFNSDESNATSLLGIVDKQSFSTLGYDITKESKLAFSLMTSNDVSNSELTGMDDAKASGAAIAYTTKLYGNNIISLSSSFLNEDNMLLGSVSGGVTGFDSATSISFGMGADFELADDLHFGIDANYASTSPTKNDDSLISSTSRLGSASFNMALKKDNLDIMGDKLNISLVKPMRVYSGNASLTVPVGNDNEGNPIVENYTVGLAPSGNETDLNFSYFRPVNEDLDVSFKLSHRNDADNIAGKTDSAAMFRFKYDFN